MNFLKAFFGGSKKATAVVGALLVVVLRETLGLDEATAQTIVHLVMTYIGAQGVVDLGLALGRSKTE